MISKDRDRDKEIDIDSKKRELVELGYTDRQIASYFGQTHQAISEWRNKNGIPSNKARKKEAKEKRFLALVDKGLTDVEIAKEMHMRPYTVRKLADELGVEVKNEKEKLKKKMMELYKQGLSDNEIGARVGRSGRSVVFQWRKENGLPPNSNIGLDEEEEKLRMELYNKGYVDIKIAKAVNRSNVTISNWREERGLEPNGKKLIGPSKKGINKLPEEEHQRRMELYKQGLSDPEIGKIIGLKPKSVSAWRKEHNLESNYLKNRKKKSKKSNSQ